MHKRAIQWKQVHYSANQLKVVTYICARDHVHSRSAWSWAGNIANALYLGQFSSYYLFPIAAILANVHPQSQEWNIWFILRQHCGDESCLLLTLITKGSFRPRYHEWAKEILETQSQSCERTLYCRANGHTRTQNQHQPPAHHFQSYFLRTPPQHLLRHGQVHEYSIYLRVNQNMTKSGKLILVHVHVVLSDSIMRLVYSVVNSPYPLHSLVLISY